MNSAQFGDLTKAENTGGEIMHTLTLSEMPKHSHQFKIHSGQNGGWTIPQCSNGDGEYMAVTELAGEGSPHNNLPPFIVVYMWKRTA